MQLPHFTRRSWIIVAVVSALGAILALRSRDRTLYEPYTVEARDLEETLELSGQIEANGMATLRFGAGGYVTYIGASQGDTVAKWQTLASVDTRQLQKVLEQKLNLYAVQRGTFDQTVDDNDNSIPDGDLARTLERLLAKNQYQLDNTVLDVEYQDLALKLARLTSPISGILIQAPTNVANVQVSPADTWVVVDPTSLEFVADLDETDLARVQEGQSVRVTLDAFPDQPLVSTVGQISYSPKETTTGTTYEVRIQLPSEALTHLRLGLNGTASVTIDTKSSVPTLPSGALTLETGGYVVYIQTDQGYEARQVKPGIEDGTTTEILEGVQPGEVVYAQKEE